MKLKLYASLLSFVLLFLSGCVSDLEIKENNMLSDKELESKLKSDLDFSSFITSKAKEINGLKSKLISMSPESKSHLSTIYRKYSNEQDFIINGTVTERNFIKSTFEENSSLYLSRVLQRIEKFEFNKEALTGLIANELMIAMEISKLNQFAKTAISCDEIAMNAYVMALNKFYFVYGMDIVSADLHASAAGAWAGWGCIQARAIE